MPSPQREPAVVDLDAPEGHPEHVRDGRRSQGRGAASTTLSVWPVFAGTREQERGPAPKKVQGPGQENSGRGHIAAPAAPVVGAS